MYFLLKHCISNLQVLISSSRFFPVSLSSLNPDVFFILYVSIIIPWLFSQLISTFPFLILYQFYFLNFVERDILYMLSANKSVDILTTINSMEFEDKWDNWAQWLIICNGERTLTFHLMYFSPNYLLDSNSCLFYRYSNSLYQNWNTLPLHFYSSLPILFTDIIIYPDTTWVTWGIFNYFSGTLYLIVIKILIYLPLFYF